MSPLTSEQRQAILDSRAHVSMADLDEYERLLALRTQAGPQGLAAELLQRLEELFKKIFG